jgi:hypothetical protein
MKSTNRSANRKSAAGGLKGGLLTLKKMLMLFLSGFAVGLFLISIGWARTENVKYKAEHKKTAPVASPKADKEVQKILKSRNSRIAFA